MKLSELDRRMRLSTCISELQTEGEAIDAILAIERKFDMIGSTWTRGDVNERFGDIRESLGHARRDMTDEEWDTFRNGSLWRKYYQEHCGSMNDAIVDEIYYLNLEPKEDADGHLLQ